MASLAENQITDRAARMGRPPIGKFTAVRLPPEMLERIDALAPAGRRAEFIREAVERELERRERIEARSDKTA
jgi:predicted DNA-binding protein